MNVRFDINTKAVIKHVATLERISEKAMVKSVRFALNQAAFDVKTKTMPKTAADKFEKRSPNFFKANSKVQKAEGLNIRNMKSMVGFVSDNLKDKATNYAVKDLEQQEHGGRIGGRSLVPLDTARVGNSYAKPVRPGNRMKALDQKGVINAKNSKGKNVKEKFVRAAIKAGVGGYVISGNKQILFRVLKSKSNLKTRKTELRLEPLYKFKRNGKVKVDKTHFMEKASFLSAQKIDNFFVEEAKKQISKLR